MNNLIIDLGGTLISTKKNGVYTTIWQWLQDKTTLIKTNNDKIKLASLILCGQSKREVLKQISEFYQLNINQKEKLKSILKNITHDSFILENSMEILKAFKHANFQITFATNVASWIPLPQNELLNFADHYYSSTNLKVIKQDLKFWEILLSQIRINIKQSIVIGDSYSSDIENPKKLGFSTFLFNPKSKISLLNTLDQITPP